MTKEYGLLFPGQGAQFVGMGSDLAAKFPAAKAVFDWADAILGYGLQSICFNGPEDELTRTIHAQPGIFTMSLAALEVMKELGGERPVFSAGLSLGEFTALVAAGSLSAEDGLRLVQMRAEAMEEAAQARPGTMASVMGLDESGCLRVAEEAGCEMANLNAPDQFVLSGTVESIEKACVLAPQQGAKRAIRLKVGGAFHSSLMEKAREKLEAALRDTEIRPPSCLFVPNVTGLPESDPEVIRDLLARQLMSSVQWVRTMATAASEGPAHYYEVGPSRVLKGLARRCQPDLTIQSLGQVEDFEQFQSIRNT